MMDISDYDYELPAELIAQTPSDKRDESRLLVLEEKTGEISHKLFKEIIDYLKKEDVLVLNNTKVMQTKLIGRKTTGSPSEVILIDEKEKNVWTGLLTSKNPKIGTKLEFFGKGDEKITASIILQDENLFTLRFDDDVNIFLKNNGLLPMPPYVEDPSKISSDRYQTVFSKNEGSLAAPTAGLHFTDGLLQKIKEKGVKIAEVSLHVSYGTFLPIRSKNILDHKMGSEEFMITKEAADIINNRKGRLIVVGTTSLKCLESASDKDGKVKSMKGHSDMYITPAYKTRVKPDALITNFHLPKSTLIILVCTYFEKDKIFSAYNEAIKKKYRFYSFGDAMMLLK